MKFIEGLKKNTSLLSLNVANNNFPAEIGVHFRNCLNENHTLIDFEFGNNAFKLDDVRKIQEYLGRNKAEYDRARL